VAVPTQDARLKSCSLLDDQIAEVRLGLDVPVVYQIGQFCQLTIPGTQITRAFSMTALEGVRSDELVFHVKLRPNGAMSCWLREQVGQSGASLQISQPHGEVSPLLHAAFTRVLCLAGGSGLGVAASVGLELGSASRAQRIDFLTVNRHGISEYHRRLIAGVPKPLLGPFALNLPYSTFVEHDAAIVEQLSRELAACRDSLSVVCGSSTIVERGCELLRKAGFEHARIMVIPFENAPAEPLRAVTRPR
jgi:ferredoxin-NADP reductase